MFVVVPVSDGRFCLISLAHVLGVGGLKGGQKEVVGEKVPSQVHEIVDNVDLPLGSVAFAQLVFGLGVAGVHNQDQGQSDQGRDQGRYQEVHDRSQSNHSVHLGIQTGCACDGIQ